MPLLYLIPLLIHPFGSWSDYAQVADGHHHNKSGGVQYLMDAEF